jgi:hypothetical protein
MKTFLLLLLIAATSCSNDKSVDPVAQLPPETQTGANTFGAIINGKVMIPWNSIGYIPPGSNHYAVRYYRNDNWEKIVAADSRNTATGSIYIHLQKKEENYPLKIGVYKIGNSTVSFIDDYADTTLINVSLRDASGNGEYYLSIADSGIVTITASDENIVSGTFSCKLKNENNSEDIIEIKSGRFDFNKNTINTTNFP